MDLSLLSISIQLIIISYFLLWLLLGFSSLIRDKKDMIKKGSPNDNHLVSVILPARDEENVITNILDDLSKQTFKDIEVIVVAHNCKDRTFERSIECSKHLTIPVRVERMITMEFGKGLGLQRGLLLSHGDLIIYFDSDSNVPPDYIEKMVKWIEAGNDAVQGKIVGKNQGYNKLTFLQHMENMTFMTAFWGGKSRLGLNAGIGGTGVMVKKKVLDAIGGYRNRLIEDFDLFLRLDLGGYKVAYAEDAHVFDEKVPDLKALIRQRSRWIAGHFELIRDYSLGKKLTLLRKNPIDFMQLYAPVLLIALWISLLMFFLPFMGITYWTISLAHWVPLTLFMIIMFALVLKRQGVTLLQSLKYSLALYGFCLHWYPALIKAFFVKGWIDTKTEHGYLRPCFWEQVFLSQVPIGNC
jgi:cellulose synthase/poly-beta-1,6-N-acetylglucosamine synthase-like glycosyltransferase